MMADKNSLLQYVAQKVGPDQLKAMVDQAEQQLMHDPDINAQSIDDIIKSLEHVAEHPEDYQRVLADAIRSGVVNQGDMPPTFNPIVVGVMLLAFLGLRERLMSRRSSQQSGMGALSNMGAMGAVPMQNSDMNQQMPQQPQQFARGGLASLGRGGDTMLAHINPREAEVLHRMGGSGHINPLTGLPEFKSGILSSVGKIFKAVIPIVATAFGGPLAGMLAGAVMGGIGGGGLKGAIIGGLGGAMAGGGASGFASSVGNSALSYLPSSVGSSLANTIGAQAIGAGLIGGASSAITGGNPLKGALTAGLTSYAAPKLADSFGSSMSPGYANAMSTGAQSTAMMGGNPLVGAAGGALGQYAGSMAGLTNNNAPIEDRSTGFGTAGDTTVPIIDKSTGAGIPGNTPVAASQPSLLSDTSKLLMLGTLLGGKTPQAAAGSIAGSNLTDEQKEALNRSLTSYTASWNSPTLPQQGTPEYDQMMSKVGQGIGMLFSQPTLTVNNQANSLQPTPPIAPVPQQFSYGGRVSNSNYYASGGRADDISAKLSQGEYVFDAETVALLGDGDSKAGAAKLDELRKQIRQQKGRSLAKGKISPNAKGALSYMKGGM